MTHQKAWWLFVARQNQKVMAQQHVLQRRCNSIGSNSRSFSFRSPLFLFGGNKQPAQQFRHVVFVRNFKTLSFVHPIGQWSSLLLQPQQQLSHFTRLSSVTTLATAVQNNYISGTVTKTRCYKNDSPAAVMTAGRLIAFVTGILTSSFLFEAETPASGNCSTNHSKNDTVVATIRNNRLKSTKISTCHCEEQTPASAEKATKTNELPLCGEWCAKQNDKKQKQTKCRMDPTIIPCKDDYCGTTCELWKTFVLDAPQNSSSDISTSRGHNGIPVDCQIYKDGYAYPMGARPCDVNCLIDEVRPSRYPLPSGLGFFCTPGTCRAGASPKHAQFNKTKGLGVLQCPCNWFGSECEDDWIPVTNISFKERYGGLDLIRLQLPSNKFHHMMHPKTYDEKGTTSFQPGSVVRIQTKDDNDNIYEASFSIAKISSQTNTIDILVAPTDQKLRWEARYVPDLLRKCTSSTTLSNDKNSTTRPKFYVNPPISGFYNQYYTFLMDYIKTRKDHNKIKDVVVVATGSALGGALTAIEALIEEEDNVNNNKPETTTKKKNQQKATNETETASGSSSSRRNIYFYYGCKNVKDLPYIDRFEKLASKKVVLTIVESEPSKNDDTTTTVTKTTTNTGRRSTSSSVIEAAAERGKHNKQNSQHTKFYVHHAFENDLITNNNRNGKGWNMSRTIFILCGRIPMVDGTRKLLLDHCSKEAANPSSSSECENTMKQHIFVNI